MAYNERQIPRISFSEADIKHHESVERKKVARFDMQKIDEAILNGNFEEKIALHRKLDCKYQACIHDWGKSLWGYDDAHGFNYNNLIDDNSVKDNLNSMRAKIESFGMGFNAKKMEADKTHNTNVNVNNINSNTNEICISITFEQST